MPADRARAAAAIANFLDALGHSPASEPELARTPELVASAGIDELLDGYDVEIETLLKSESSPIAEEMPSIVALRDLTVTTICPLHLMPARGTASVAYAPGSRIAGLGAIARLVNAYAHRLTLQETI